MPKPLLLLTNDDGITSPGILALREALEHFADVVVCAPERNQSAVSHGLTLQSVLRLRRLDEATYALDGTPADCVYVALNSGERVLSRTPAGVVSGMNHGPNLGVDVNYSGTVAAAREAALRGLLGVAVSVDPAAPMAPAAACAARLVREALAHAATEEEAGRSPLLLNVNIPVGEDWAVQVTQQGGRPYEEEVLSRTDPRGREYLWIGGGVLGLPADAASDSDTAAFHAGDVSVTPLVVDLCARERRALVERIVARCR